MRPGSSVPTSEPTLAEDEDDANVEGGGHVSTGEDTDDDYEYMTMGDDNAGFDNLVYDDGVDEDGSVLTAVPSASPSNLPSAVPSSPLEELRLYDKVPPNEDDSAAPMALVKFGFLASILVTMWV